MRTTDDLLPRLTCMCITLALAAASCVWVLQYSSIIPFYDDWSSIPVMSGQDVLSLEFLMKPQNGHIAPVTRLIAYAIFRLGLQELRPDLFINLLSLTSASYFFLSAVWKIRGRAEYIDSAIPIILLNACHIDMFRYYVTGYAYLCILCISALTYLLVQRAPSSFELVTGGITILLLPLQGGGGLLATIPMSVGLAILLQRTSTVKPMVRTITQACLLGALLLFVYLTIAVMNAPKGFALKPTVLERFELFVGLFAVGTGYIGIKTWFVTGTSLCIASIWIVFQNAKKHFDRIPKHQHMLLFPLLACLATPVAISLFRGSGDMLSHRYVILTSPLICLLFAISEFSFSKTVANFMQFAIFFVATSALAYHESMGRELGKLHSQTSQDLLNDIDEGSSMQKIVASHSNYWCYSEDAFEDGLKALSNSDISPFSRIKSHALKTILVNPKSLNIKGDSALHESGIAVKGNAATIEYEPQNICSLQRAVIEIEILKMNSEVSCTATTREHETGATHAVSKPIFVTGPNCRKHSIWIDKKTNKVTFKFTGENFNFLIKSITLERSGASENIL